MKERTRRLQERFNTANIEVMTYDRNPAPAKSTNFEKPPADLSVDLQNRPLTGSTISRDHTIITLKAKPDLDVDLDDSSLTAQFMNSAVKTNDAVERNDSPQIASRVVSPIIASPAGVR